MNPTKIHTLISRTILGSLLLIIGLLLSLIVGILFYNNPPVRFFNVPFPVDQSLYYPGDDILATVNYCKYNQAFFTTSIAFVDGLIFSAPERIITGAPRGCGEIRTVLMTIPSGLPAGTYYLLGRNTYDFGFITRSVEWITVPFTVAIP